MAVLERRFLLRLATPRDLPDLMDIERASFSTPWTLGEMEEEFSLAYSRLWVAEEAGRVAGFAVHWLIAGESQLADLAVHPDFRRRGVARLLMEHLLREARSEGMAKMTLEVREGSDPAETLYRALGFVETCRRPRFYEDRDTAILMEKALET